RQVGVMSRVTGRSLRRQTHRCGLYRRTYGGPLRSGRDPHADLTRDLVRISSFHALADDSGLGDPKSLPRVVEGRIGVEGARPCARIYLVVDATRSGFCRTVQSAVRGIPGVT